jgi:hypothetical protein
MVESSMSTSPLINKNRNLVSSANKTSTSLQITIPNKEEINGTIFFNI